jgi:hypothetical protein
MKYPTSTGMSSFRQVSKGRLAFDATRKGL